MAAFMFYLLLTGTEHILAIYFPMIGESSLLAVVFVISLVLALIFTFADSLFSERLLRLFPTQLFTSIKIALYSLLALALLYWPFHTNYPIHSFTDIENLVQNPPIEGIAVFRFAVFFLVFAALNSFIQAARKKVGYLNFNRWVSGVLNKPLEEERIFMFIDLKGSTTIAEKMGHKKFSHLVQDVFNDMSMMDNYSGQIYQYLGDGAIVSWDVHQGLKQERFLAAFFAFNKLIHRRRRYYQRKYQLVPAFKAGVHIGKVMVLQVGKHRRDISYNGDTMNTAARIESKCNELKQNLLISETLYQYIESKKDWKFKSAGEIALKGKRKAVGLWGVKEK
jgi:adenylate cyclase